MLTFRQFLRAESARLREQYPESTRDERRACLADAEGRWILSLYRLPRETIVPLNVGRSLVAIIGHAEASRMLRHVANFPACLPIAQRTAEGAAS